MWTTLLGLLAIAPLVDGLARSAGALALAAGALAGAALAWNVARAGAPPAAPSTLYLGALAAFHLGLLVPWALGVAEEPVWLAATAGAAIGRALLAVMLAVVCYELGLLVGWGRGAPSLRPAPAVRRGASALHGGGLALAALAVLAALANLGTIGIGRFLSTSYGYEIYAAADSRLLQTALFWLLPAAALIALAGARPGREARRALALAGTAALLLLWAGDRGGAVALGAAATVVWTYGIGAVPRRPGVRPMTAYRRAAAGIRGCGVADPSVRAAVDHTRSESAPCARGAGRGSRRVGLLVAAGALAVLVVIPAVGMLRQLPRNGVSLAEVRRAALAASPLAALTEMGGSVRPLIETLRLVPAETPYRLGSSYAQAALRVVPNVGLTRAAVDWNDPVSLPPNHWITYLVAPWTYAAYGGIGFSAVAEPYLNFGVAGIAGYFLALGALLGRLDRALAAAPSRRRLALAAVVCMPLLLTVRNDFHGFARAAAWGVAAVLAVEWAHGDAGRRVRRRRAWAPDAARLQRRPA